MSDFRSAFGEPPAPKPSSIEVWVASLSDEDRRWFHEQLKDPRWTNQALLEAIRRTGKGFNAGTLASYRKNYVASTRLVESK